LFDVEHRFLDLEGARIHDVDEGIGETLLLLHGNPAWSFPHREIIAGLKDEFRCVAPDYPGYGMSSAPAGYRFTPSEQSAVLERFVDRLRLTELTLMVQDWGGPVGLGLAGRRPELLRRLIIGNTFAWPLNGEFRVRMFSALMGGPIGRRLNRHFMLVPRVFFARGLAQETPRKVLGLNFAPWRDPARRAPAAIGPKQLIAAADYLYRGRGQPAEDRRPSGPDRLGTKGLRLPRRRTEALRGHLPQPPNHALRQRLALSPEDVGELIAEAFKSFRSESGE
jgi:haloalkane dehalogenase